MFPFLGIMSPMVLQYMISTHKSKQGNQPPVMFWVDAESWLDVKRKSFWGSYANMTVCLVNIHNIHPSIYPPLVYLRKQGTKLGTAL